MSIVPKIRNKPPRMDGGQWVYWDVSSPFPKFENILAWRYGWDCAHEIKLSDMRPEMNFAGMMWFCTDMDWYAAQAQWRHYQLHQAMNNMQQGMENMTGCQSCRKPAQGSGLFGGMFGSL